MTEENETNEILPPPPPPPPPSPPKQAISESDIPEAPVPRKVPSEWKDILQLFHQPQSIETEKIWHEILQKTLLDAHERQRQRIQNDTKLKKNESHLSKSSIPSSKKRTLSTMGAHDSSSDTNSNTSKSANRVNRLPTRHKGTSSKLMQKLGGARN